MAERTGEADRVAHGAGSTEAEQDENNQIMPGVVGGGVMYLPESGRAQAGSTGADHVEGTIGAVGEMDFTGASAGPGGASGPSGGMVADESQGGGTGGGAASGGGTGPADGSADG
jgi:hypothetical protein